jgi:hypothetical protein
VIQSLSPFRFDLAVVLRSRGAHNGEIVGGTATLQGTRATYHSASDCTITFDLFPRRIDVVQTGTCESAGFGAYVDASGRYNRSR